MKLEYLSYLYLCILLVSFAGGMYRYNLLDKASRIFAIYLGVSFLSECVAYYTAYKYHNNLVVYAIYNIIELGFIAMYFNYCIDVFHKYSIGVYIAVIGVVLGIANILYVQHLNDMNLYFLFFEGTCIIAMCLFSFFRILLKHEQLILTRYVHFWLPSLILLYWTVTYLYWGLYDVLFAELGNNIWIVNDIILLINILIYIVIGVVYLRYPKMKQAYE